MLTPHSDITDLQTTAPPDTGAALFVAALAANGIDTIYGIPGEETTDLLAAIQAHPGIDMVLCRHEQGAAFMASVHARLTGRVAACLATLGPGASNLITGLADATLDFAPVLAITGQAARQRLGRESHQVLALDRLFAPVTKQSRTLLTLDALEGAVAEAVAIATEPRPGAVHLSLPEDLAAAPLPDGLRRLPAVPPAAPMAAPRSPDVQAIATDIRRARAPVILCGAGVVRADAAASLRALSQRLNAPVVESFMAKGVMDPNETLSAGVIGLPEHTRADTCLAGADLIIAVGFDPVELEPRDFLGDAPAPVIALGQDRAARDAGWQLAGECIGDLNATLRALTQAMQGHQAPAPQSAFLPDVPTDAQATDADHPARLIEAINTTCGRDDIILSGVGNHKLWVARSFRAQRPGQAVIPNGLAGMGLALPGAIAAARLFPDRPVLALCGDGDVMMNVQEMETATRLGVDLTVCVWVDGGYGLIERKEQDETGSFHPLGFGPIDWQHLAAAFGWSHHAPETAEGLEMVLHRCREKRGRNLVICPVRYPDVPKRG